MVVIDPALLPAALICLLIGWARLLAGHHYLSDILAGIALGALASVPAIMFLR
jgi:membrane-associated phospholipid phosphatase